MLASSLRRKSNYKFKVGGFFFLFILVFSGDSSSLCEGGGEVVLNGKEQKHEISFTKARKVGEIWCWVDTNGEIINRKELTYLPFSIYMDKEVTK